MSRQRLFGAIVALPAALVSVVGVWSLVTNSAGGWVWAPDSVTLSEAVAVGDYAEVARQIERGVDPNPPADVRARLLGSRPVRVTPLQAAVWSRNAIMLKMLLARGAIVSPTSLMVLKCMNGENGNREVGEVLDTLPASATTACADLSIPR